MIRQTIPASPDRQGLQPPQDFLTSRGPRAAHGFLAPEDRLMWNAHRMDGRGYGTGTAVLVGDAIITRLRAAEVMAAPAGAMAGGRGIFEDALSRAAARMVRTIRIGRVLAGMFLILHGVAHAPAGTALTDPTRAWRLFQGTTLETL